MLVLKVPEQFLDGYFEIDKIMKRYIGHLGQQKIVGQPLLIPYDSHTVVRALESLFFKTFLV